MKAILALLALLPSIVFSLFEFRTPLLSPAIKDSTEGFYSFLNLWEYSIRMDSNSRNSGRVPGSEPKTLMIPGDQAMAHLVPQDGTHPLYIEKNAQLRRQFLLDHLVFNLTPTNHPAMSSPEGWTDRTLSGKNITIRRDASDDLYVENVMVKKTITLPGNYHIFVLQEPLFNHTKKVREAFNQHHEIEKEEALGPPLDIPYPTPIRAVRKPPPTPCEHARAPSPPTGEEKLIFDLRHQPPAPP